VFTAEIPAVEPKEPAAACQICQNGGVLKENADKTGFKCQCTTGWAGLYCQKCSACPDDFEHSAQYNLCIKVVTVKAKRADADALCKKQNPEAQLVSFTGIRQHEFTKALLSTMDKSKFSDCPRATFYTSGQRLSDCTSEYVWKPNNTPIPYNPSLVTWYPTQPSCTSGAAELCMIMFGETSYNMHDTGCSDEYCSVCQIVI
jgi:hypothetical protein